MTEPYMEVSVVYKGSFEWNPLPNTVFLPQIQESPPPALHSFSSPGSSLGLRVCHARCVYYVFVHYGSWQAFLLFQVGSDCGDRHCMF